VSFSKALSLVALITSMSACAATQLHAGAEQVLVTRQPAPPGCQYVQTVIGEQGGALTGGLTSNRHLAEGSMNDMKNRAHDAGANYVVIEDSRAGNTFSGSNGSLSGQQTDVTTTGNAYRCPNDPTVVAGPAGTLASAP